jgi:cytochrome c-type biogenesis protein CcmE
MTASASNKITANRAKFIVGGFLFLIAVIFLIISATKSSAEFFMTVREVQESDKDLTGQNLRVSGAVLGDSISYDSDSGLLSFTIANIPADNDEITALGGLSSALHQAVSDPESPRLAVIYQGFPPDMLRNEAQAILTGTLSTGGVFEAEELLLKCPSKYEDAVPNQVENE